MIRRCFLIAFLIIPTFTSPASAKENSLTPAELEAGWILLFDGDSLYGWKAGGKADWQVVDGAIRVASGEKSLLCTTTQFGDYELKLDFRCSAKTNSGVFLATPLQPTNPAGDCYELNIAAPEISEFPTGSLVGRKKGETTPHSDAWHSYEVTHQNGRVQVKLDGKPVLDYTDPKPLRRGFIGLQLNEGQVEFRNIKLKPLDLQPIFNGKNLDGWKADQAKESEFSVTGEGALHVKNGPGQLESTGHYGDFVLQFEVFVNGKELNSGVFFRSIPGDFQNGYEAQIHNGVKPDSDLPNNGGTGGIFRRQEARRVVSRDFEWTYVTVIAEGPHLACWVNGVQVSDWTDARPPHANPRNGLRLEPGSLILQGHDPTTDFTFRDFRIQEMAPRGK